MSELAQKHEHYEASRRTTSGAEAIPTPHYLSPAMRFEDAFFKVRQGMVIVRESWKGRANGVYMKNRLGGITLPQPALMIETYPGDEFPWVPSQKDLLADDWRLVELS